MQEDVIALQVLKAFSRIDLLTEKDVLKTNRQAMGYVTLFVYQINLL